MGSIILLLQFVIKQNLQILEYCSIVLLKACCASLVKASASSKMHILKGTLPIDLVLAKSLTSFLMVSIPLESEALVSNIFCLKFSDSRGIDTIRNEVKDF